MHALFRSPAPRLEISGKWQLLARARRRQIRATADDLHASAERLLTAKSLEEALR
jgi:hypothetical protein